MEDRREIQQVQYNISNTSYAASAHLTPAEQRAWWQDDEPAESSALMMALHGEATCSPPSSQYMGLAGWNQMGTAQPQPTTCCISQVMAHNCSYKDPCKMMQ